MDHDKNPAEYYPLITAAAGRTGLNWWLLYAVIEQESNFDPAAESACGALGLMQLMPQSFPAWSRTSLLDPVNNVRLGAEFLRELIAGWREEAPEEAIKFGLASYNGGPGYVLKAQRLAQAAGEDSHQWAAVEWYLDAASVGGKHPDVEQITGYVAAIWHNFELRRMRPIPQIAA